VTFLSNLAFLDFVSTVCTCVITVFLAIPAYKRTKQRGFIFWTFGALGSLWNTITLHTFVSASARYFIHYTYRALFVVDSVLWIIGTVLVIRGYLALFEVRSSNQSLQSSDHNAIHIA